MRVLAKFSGVLFGIALLCPAGPAIAAPTSAGTRLVNAIQNKTPQIAPSLLKQGADPNQRQADGTTALHWAAHWDDVQTAELLLRSGANPNAANDYGATPLALACANGNAAMVKALLAKKANPNLAAPSGETPLMRCARTGNPEAVGALIAAHADLTKTDNEEGQTALMWAVAQKHPAVVKILLEKGVDFRAHSRGGSSALMFSARAGDIESARLLIAKGADVNEVGPNKMTPLLLASASGREAYAIALLDMGANPNAKDEFGATAMHYALMKGITSLDQIRIANYVAYLFRPSEQALVKALIAHKADPNARIEKTVAVGGSRTDTTIGATPFILAAATPDPAVMRILIAGGADPKLATKDGLTAVMAAAGLNRGQDFTEEDKQLSAEAVRIAVEHGGDVKAADKDGLTALHGAATNGAVATVEYLAKHGADLNARDKYQQTPLSAATGIRLPWIPYGEELGEIIQPAARDMLLKLGATPVDTKGYFKPPTEYTEVYRLNQSQRYGGVRAPAKP